MPRRIFRESEDLLAISYVSSFMMTSAFFRAL
jgi:hypothetical protein